MISTHAPAGGATYWEILFEQWDAFLLTPLREGRRTILFSICSALHISTHAPAGGATRDADKEIDQLVISTHAPAGGATFSFSGKRRFFTFLLTPLREGRRSPLRWPGRCSPHFYSRPCGRGDTESTRSLSASSISTHAPAGGATPHENGRPHCRYSFLLTPLREGRPFPITEAASSSYFYSRPCGRGDQSRLPSPCWCRISTHAPAGGATNARGLPYFLLHISTHAPAGGATAVGLNPKKQMLLFLLTPLREGRPLLRHFVVTFCIVFLLTPLREGRHTAGTYPTSGFTFLLTPLREGRRPRPIFLFPRLCISTHAPAGGATIAREYDEHRNVFLLTPLREGRQQFSTSPS